jgi:hypothetical protein
MEMIVCIWIMLCGRPVAMLDMVRKLESLDTFADKIMREAGRYSRYGQVWTTQY